MRESIINIGWRTEAWTNDDQTINTESKREYTVVDEEAQ